MTESATVLVLASWSVRDLAVALGLPTVVCVSLFMLVVAAITRD